MKKILSVILAVTLIAGLFPSAFAAIDEATGLNTITYNFNQSVFGKESRYDFTSETAGFGTVPGADTSPFSVLRWSAANSLTTTYFDGSSYRITAKSGSVGALLLEIEVDKAGAYLPSVEFKREARSGYLELYVMQDVSKLSGANDATGLDSKLFSDITSNYSRVDDTRIDTATSASETYTTYEYTNAVNLKEGKNYLAIVLNTANPTAEALKAGKAMLYVNSVTFKEVKTEPAPEPEDTDIVSYEFDYDSLGQSESDAGSITLSHTEDEGTVQGGANWTVLHTNFSTRAIYKTYAKFTAVEGDDGQPAPAGIQLAITVPESGTYSPAFKYQKIARGGHLKVYIHDEPVAASVIRDIGYRDAYADLTPLDDKYINLNTGESDWNICTFENVTLNKGTNYLTFVVDGTSVDSSVSKWNRPMAHIEYFALTPVKDAPSNSVSYCETSNLPDAEMNIRSVTRGSSITVSAEEVDGYTFRAWVRGSADNGTWVSSDAKYTFSPMTHTMLTAVYTKNPAENEMVVEYYNENGEYIETKNTTEEAPVPTKLVGYVFDDWYVGEDTKLDLTSVVSALTRAVAKHTVENTTYTVNFDGSADDYKYDELVTLTSPTAVSWKRDGKTVDFGTSYSFYVWDDTTITTSADGDNLPKVMLDKAKNGSWMIEYDEGNLDIIEAGIIFGSSDAVTVDSCSEKMISQRLDAHGQFTATSDCSVARGYIIFKNINGGLEIVYAD